MGNSHDHCGLFGLFVGDTNLSIHMKRLALALQLAAGILLLGGLNLQAQEKKADPTGTWTWNIPGRDGGPGRESTLKLKMENGNLTGAISGMRRGGDAPQETKISDAKITGNEISFVVTREFNGNSFTQKYSGKLEGDTITGKITMQGRDGQSRERDWVAKRAKEEKKAS